MLSSEDWVSFGNDLLTLQNDCIYVHLLLESQYGLSHALTKHMQGLVQTEIPRLQSDLDSFVNAQFQPPAGTYPSSTDLLPGTDIPLTKVFYGRVPYTYPNVQRTRPLSKGLTEEQTDIVYQTLTKFRNYLHRVNEYFPIRNTGTIERRLDTIGYLVQT